MKTFKTIVMATVAVAALGAASAVSASTLIGSYWVGGGDYWANNYPQLAYSPLDAAAFIFGGTAADYSISTNNVTVTHTGWTDGYGTAQHLRFNWDTGMPGTEVAEDFLPRPTYDTTGAFSAYIQDREGLLGTINNPNASINYVFAHEAAVPEPATWGLLIMGFGLCGVALRSRRRVADAAI